jgi:hypothetical protein
MEFRSTTASRGVEEQQSRRRRRVTKPMMTSIFGRTISAANREILLLGPRTPSLYNEVVVHVTPEFPKAPSITQVPPM